MTIADAAINAMGGAYSEKECEAFSLMTWMATTVSFAAIKRARTPFTPYRLIFGQFRLSAGDASAFRAGAIVARFGSDDARCLRPKVGFMAGRIGQTS